MTYAIPTEGNSVTDHEYNERLSPHVMSDSVTSHVVPDLNGSTSPNANENGHNIQEHCNGDSLSVTGASTAEETNLPEQQLNEEKSETLTNKDEGHIEHEEAPEREIKDDRPVDVGTGSPAEQKETTGREEEEQSKSSETSVFNVLISSFSPLVSSFSARNLKKFQVVPVLNTGQPNP